MRLYCLYMNLEGTKHEKAVLIVVAYIIGFTSGFIAFGISGGFRTTTVDAVATPAPFIPADYTPPTENPPLVEDLPATSPVDEIVSYEEGKLYATVKGERFVLSLHNDVMSTENVEGFSTQGIHAALPVYSSSPDGRFVHFCEQQTEVAECTHFVFDTEANVIQPVSVNGRKLVTSDDIAKTAIWSTDGLLIERYRSYTADAPWKMGISPNL
jgi:hypothetical protein